MLLEVLAPDQIKLIHESTLWILENVGIEIKNEPILHLLNKNGVNIDFSTGIAKIPCELIEECIKKTPKNITLFSRNSKYSIRLGEGNTYVHTMGGAINIIENGKARKATQSDLERITILADGLSNIHFVCPIFYPDDAPEHVKDIYAVKSVLKNTEKHVLVTPSGGSSLDYIIKMGEIIVGSEEFKKAPIISIGASPTSPLVFSKEVTEILVKAAKFKIPLFLLPCPLAGGTAPVTLAGTLVLQNAEILSGITIIQLVNPGNPVIYAPRLLTLDMKTGQAAGGIELGLMSAAAVQLARYYGIPSDVYGFWTTSKTLDEQTAFEKAFNGLLPALAGADLLSGAGLVENGISASLEQLVIDDEAYGMVLRAIKGVQVTNETLALKTIADVGPGKHFLTHVDTRKFFRIEHFLPTIFDRSSRLAWEKAGSKNIIAVASEKVLKVLREHQPVSLDKDICNELEKIALEASQNISRYKSIH